MNEPPTKSDSIDMKGRLLMDVDPLTLGFDIPVRTAQEARNYLEQEGVLQFLYRVQGRAGQIPQDLCDLARLYWLTRTRKVFTVLEFGVGWSTVLLAAAVRRNQRQWDDLRDPPEIRCQAPFSVHSVDASQQWIDNAQRLLPDELSGYVTLYYSGLVASTFNQRMCHFYERIPDVVPDFIYLDGPHPADVRGEVNGLSWNNPDRTVLSGDLLVMESTLLPGTCVLVDGRTNNARFLLNNLQRPWAVASDTDEDVTVFELQETPLGRINQRTLDYCLGQDYFERLEAK